LRRLRKTCWPEGAVSVSKKMHTSVCVGGARKMSE